MMTRRVEFAESTIHPAADPLLLLDTAEHTTDPGSPENLLRQLRAQLDLRTRLDEARYGDASDQAPGLYLRWQPATKRMRHASPDIPAAAAEPAEAPHSHDSTVTRHRLGWIALTKRHLGLERRRYRGRHGK